MKVLKDRITPSIVISSLALFVALGGASYAALGKNSVGSKQLKKNAVVTKKIKNKAVSTAKLKGSVITTGKIKNNAVTGAKVKESSLGTVPNATNSAGAELANVATHAENLDGYATLKQTKVTASPAGVDYDASEAAAPDHDLFTVGPITVYMKCFVDPSGPYTYANFYARTTQNGAMFDADQTDLYGDPDFLDTDTDLQDRELLQVDASTDSAEIDADYHYGAGFFAPDGTSFAVQYQAAAKNGTLAGGNGIYGAGDVCLYSASMIEYTG